MSLSDDILKGIRSRLLVSYPFFGSALSDMRLIPDRNVRRFYSNAVSIRYNEEYVNTATPAELAYWLCREILHITMDYGDRKRRRSMVLWALAAEYCVNSILAEEGLTKGVQVKIYRREFTGKSAEEIYSTLVRDSLENKILEEIEKIDDWLDKEADQSDLSERLHDFSGISRIMRLSSDELLSLIEESRKREDYGAYKAKTLEIISKARLSERTLGKRGFSVDLPIMTESMETMRWDDLLASYAFNDRESHSYRRFQRKYISSDIYLPQRFHLFNRVIVCVDVSASIGEDTLKSFFSDIMYLVASRPGETQVRLIQIDAEIQSDIVIGPETTHEDILRRKGFGGTDFTGLFRKLEKENNNDPVVIFTDGRAVFPDVKPDGYDVIWITTDLVMPWGTNLRYGEEVEA